MKPVGISGKILNISVFLSLAAVAVVREYTFCAGDLDTYLPFILHEHDPSLFRNELLLGTLGSHPVYIWKAMAFFLQWFDVRYLIKAAFLFQTLLVAGGALFFFRTFFGGGRGWMLFLLMLVIPVTSGGYGVYGLNPYGYFHAGALAFGLVLLTYALIDRGFWLTGGVLAGMVFLFHPVTAVYAGAFFLIRAGFDIVKGKRSGRMAAALCLLVIAALPSLVPAFQSFIAPAGAGGIDPGFWRALARFRMNHGYFISAWVPDRFLQLGACLLALFLVFRKHPSFIRLLPVVIGVAGGLVLAGLGDLFNIRLLLRLQLGRCSYFVYFLVAAFAAGALSDRALWADEKRARNAWNIAFLIGLILVGNAAVSHQAHLTRTILLSLILLAGTMTVLRFFRSVHPAVLFTCLASIVLVSTVPRSLSLFNWTTAQSLRDPWVEAAIWCSTAIPRDDIVMVPLDRENFRPRALRATYCTWKDGAPHLFCDRTLPEWWRRMQNFGVTLRSKRGDFAGLYRDRAAEVARSEGIRYVSYEKNFLPAADPGGQIVFENRGCRIIDRGEGLAVQNGLCRLVPRN